MRNFVGKKIFFLALVLLGSCSAFTFAAKQPIVEYLFNEIGSKAESTGWDKTAFVLKNKDGEADLHTEGGLGVSGSLTDRAFDNTWWEKGSGNHGIAVQGKNSKELEGLKSCTWQGWFKSEERLAPGARIFEKPGSYTLCGWNGSLQLAVGGVAVTSKRDYMVTDEWVYFAVTYDGTSNSENVNFYVGSVTQPVKLVSTHTIDKSMGPSPHNAMRAGAWGIGTSALRAYLDNMRMFGSKSDNSGVLTLEELEALRIKDTYIKVDGEKSKLNVSSETVALGETVVITVEVRDVNDTIVGNRKVVIESVGGDIALKPMTATAGADGKAKFTLASGKEGSLVVKASIVSEQESDPIGIKEQVKIKFVKK